MPIWQQLLDSLSGRDGPGPRNLVSHRLLRVSRKPQPAPARPALEEVIEALEEECAQPLYERSVYVSNAQEPPAV